MRENQHFLGNGYKANTVRTFWKSSLILFNRGDQHVEEAGLSLSHREGNFSPEGLNELPKATELAIRGAGSGPQIWLQRLHSPPHTTNPLQATLKMLNKGSWGLRKYSSQQANMDTLDNNVQILNKKHQLSGVERAAPGTTKSHACPRKTTCHQPPFSGSSLRTYVCKGQGCYAVPARRASRGSVAWKVSTQHFCFTSSSSVWM